MFRFIQFQHVSLVNSVEHASAFEIYSSQRSSRTQTIQLGEAGLNNAYAIVEAKAIAMHDKPFLTWSGYCSYAIPDVLQGTQSAILLYIATIGVWMLTMSNWCSTVTAEI